ncbi:MAG TPA: hypothetical protein VE842_00115 [Pyrinomonadaceae bacterium]|nr:hypothetical protein [Pyrinomonadaceae bacterium]
MNEDSSSGGRGPSSIKPPTIKPPTIKPPTARDDVWGETTLGSAPGAALPQSAPVPVGSALPPMERAAAAPPGRQNLWLWVVLGLLFLAILVVGLAVVVLLWLM